MLSFTLKRGQSLSSQCAERKTEEKATKMQAEVKATYEEFSVSVEHVNHAVDDGGHDAVPLRF